jgi:hypothetical protein
MIKLSSGFTLLFKLFIPIFWVVFFGALFFTFIFMSEGSVLAGRPYFKWVLGMTYIGWTALLYFTVFKLKRVEGNTEGLFISNYFKHIFIPFDHIDQFNETNLGLFIFVRVRFNRKTYFGKRIFFLASAKRFGEFVSINADKLAN